MGTIPENVEFRPFPKMARLSRQCIITEKIDGTNAQVFITESGDVFAGSRNRWLTPEADNFGFASWVEQHKEELLQLGPGRHFGEWWGLGIQRGYGMHERRFSLFNALRWHEKGKQINSELGTTETPSCVHVVPVLAYGLFSDALVETAIEGLRTGGSDAAPFNRPEGIIVYHVAAGVGFKKTLENDAVPKGLA